MSFSIKAILVGFLFIGMWLAVICTGSLVGYELASVATVFAILVSLPLAFFDEDIDRRPFWGGFFVLGAGYFVAMMTNVSEIGALGQRLADLANNSSQTSHLQLVAKSFPYLFCLFAAVLGGVVTSILSRSN